MPGLRPQQCVGNEVLLDRRELAAGVIVARVASCQDHVHGGAPANLLVDVSFQAFPLKIGPQVLGVGFLPKRPALDSKVVGPEAQAPLGRLDKRAAGAGPRQLVIESQGRLPLPQAFVS